MMSLTKWSLALVLILLLVLAGVALGSEDDCRKVIGQSLCVTMSLTPQVPHLDETAEVLAKVKTLYEDVLKAEVCFGPSDGKQQGVELVGSPAKYTTSFERGIWKEFRFKIKFVSSPANVSINVRALQVRHKDGSIGHGLDWKGGGAGYILTMSPSTKEFGVHPIEEDPYGALQARLSLTNEPNGYSIAVHLDQNIKEFVKQTGKPEEEVINIIKMKADKIQKQKMVAKSKAYETILKEQLLWKDAGLPYPFSKPKRQTNADKDQGRLNPQPDGLVQTTLTGYWYYDDHKYNTSQGLLAIASPEDTIKPIGRCILEVWDLGSDSLIYEQLDTVLITGQNDGYFGCAIWQWASYFPYTIRFRIKARGPNFTSPYFTVDDTFNATWKYDTLKSVFAGGTYSFPNLHPSRYIAGIPSLRQPKSGAWNIFDVLLRAATTKVGYPSTLLRVKWDPKLKQTTGFSPDSNIIQINGWWDDPGGITGSRADEWHDDAILHEYGHAKYWDWNQYNQWYGNHTWWKSYPADTFLAFNEGWAHFFSGVVRDSVLTSSWGNNDSLIVVTNGRIAGGADSLEFVGLEEPWSFKWSGVSNQDSFKAGPWCEGAVSGVLFDIMDRYRENPYPRHPKNPEWPDSLLADSMRIPVTPPWLATPYFDVVKNYRIDNHPVRTIYEFLSGWMHPPAHPDYSYGHVAEICSILTHHRIPWNRPAAPTGLTAVGKCPETYMVLNWNSVSGVMGYNIYRSVDDLPYSYTRRNVELITGTEFWDYESQYTLWRYAVTSVDSQGNESDFSQTVSQSYACINPDRPGSQSGGALGLIPTEFGLSQNEPNPLSNETNIRFALPKDVHAQLRIYDVQGRLARTLVDADLKAAYHRVRWDLKSDAGVELPAGIYFIRMEAGDFRKTRKLVVVR